MKKLDNYYLFKKDLRYKTKFYSVLSGDYGRLDILKNKDGLIVVNLLENNYTKANIKGELKFAAKGNHISRVISSKQDINVAVGDFIHTNDLLIFIFNDDKTEFELLIAKDKKYESNLYLNMLFDGVLRDEINDFRQIIDSNSNAA